MSLFMTLVNSQNRFIESHFNARSANEVLTTCFPEIHLNMLVKFTDGPDKSQSKRSGNVSSGKAIDWIASFIQSTRVLSRRSSQFSCPQWNSQCLTRPF